MAFHRDASDPLQQGERIGRVHEELRLRSRVVSMGTLACPRCDAPVSPGGRALSPAEPIGCPFCGESGRVRDFLSLEAPTRAAHVEIVISPRGARGAG
ncbi:hypothetical protein DVA67_032135 [Solirubrobacter sp. CPCC 204708]|uniref:Zinc ribbon domain-containing protein n=1 Tax=Solirubrobacter deserti TaxID=2282478 RepID=A0ABT4RQ58_9ACTN|nr:hypothetical protein [Solirubrobacter deserti]MBE2320654.1 hypothetical protein [Solirubrobacter deserti]MDA0140707.1 hypothetical protein [Solirubrobacter deserti]